METSQANDSCNSHNLYARVPLNRRRCHESQRLNVCSIFALRGLCVGHCSNARNKLKSHRGNKKKTQQKKKHCCFCALCAKVWGEVKKDEKDRWRIWKEGRKVEQLNETKEVCTKCQKCAEGCEESPKKEGEKRKERSECTRRNFWRINAAFLRWDGANSAADWGSQVSSRWLMH